jgi:hypothetical protein
MFSEAMGGRSARPELGIFAKILRLVVLSTMNISVPDSLKAFVEEQVADKGYGTSGRAARSRAAELPRADDRAGAGVPRDHRSGSRWHR